jgi:hypothetical protein
MFLVLAVPASWFRNLSQLTSRTPFASLPRFSSAWLHSLTAGLALHGLDWVYCEEYFKLRESLNRSLESCAVCEG